ncbi:hypothetical protein DSO57_1018443 [Entomophthora muscae]|uniref:Uncharacterized protein n=1 Tax=Entomophthora muscae TaxID=34485 RepID=A0ACC2UP51_9FUNG|nr:hypothetical protein DSO57_1018443 [Entomophthora muscae]
MPSRELFIQGHKDSLLCVCAAPQNMTEALKQTLMCAPVLAYPNFEKPFVVHIDASLTAIGGALSQLDDNRLEHHIG